MAGDWFREMRVLVFIVWLAGRLASCIGSENIGKGSLGIMSRRPAPSVGMMLHACMIVLDRYVRVRPFLLAAS